MRLMPRMNRAGRLAVVVAVVPIPFAVAAGATAGGGGGEPASGTAKGPTRTVELVAHHSRFSPASVSVPVGTTVRFVVRNLDPIDHELIVGGPDVHRRHEVGREAHHHGDVAGEVSVPAGKSATTTWTATEMGPTVFACHLPGHLAYGMAGTIGVTTRS
ncbi:MAG: cupredoxin domain-containing protein [Acidimicrobiales bacterium]